MYPKTENIFLVYLKKRIRTNLIRINLIKK